jgi:hypothetical protein
MRVFHEIPEASVDTVLQRGLLLSEGGSKTDKAIARTDTYLNQYRPDGLIKNGLDRETNTYCYVCRDDKIIDITSGQAKSITEFIRESREALLQIDVDPGRCYVSDLDLYDQIKALLATDDTTNAERLARVYWSELMLLADYHGDVHRPEVIIPYNIPPSVITRVS